jgi:Fic family protein
MARACDHTSGHIRTRAPKLYSHELVSLLFEMPYYCTSSLIETGIAKRQTASLYLKQITEIDVLAEVDAGKEKLFIHPKLMRMLTQENNEFSLYGQSC